MIQRVLVLLGLLHGALGGKTNFLFLKADDMGYGDPQYNGGVAHTPTLDAMANGQHTVLFSRFYAGAPVCSPTRYG
jgi:arylsulfatase A-like enzyme